MSNMEELLQCMICFKPYDNNATSPRQLPCQHHLCSACLPFMVKPQAASPGSSSSSSSRVIECPMCKQRFAMEPEQVPKSRLIVQLLESMKGSSLPKSSSGPSSSWSPPSSTTAPMLSPPLVPTPACHQEHRRSLDDGRYRPAPPPPPPPPPPPQHQQTSSTWDYKSYLRGIFNEMDINGDGHITAVELQEALKRGQSSSDFDPKTVQLLLEKYDTNGDNEISFEEFYNLFIHLNEEFENFLLMDQDGSGAIDARELEEALKKRGYTMLSHSFFDFVVNEIRARTGRQGLLFDHYCRIAARFDYLCQYYRKTPYYQKTPLEVYLRQTFFQNFW